MCIGKAASKIIDVHKAALTNPLAPILATDPIVKATGLGKSRAVKAASGGLPSPLGGSGQDKTILG